MWPRLTQAVGGEHIVVIPEHVSRPEDRVPTSSLRR